MTFKVRDLMEQLESIDPDTLVATEGCDCYGPAEGVTLVESASKVWLVVTRVPGESGLY